MREDGSRAIIRPRHAPPHIWATVRELNLLKEAAKAIADLTTALHQCPLF